MEITEADKKAILDYISRETFKWNFTKEFASFLVTGSDTGIENLIKEAKLEVSNQLKRLIILKWPEYDYLLSPESKVKYHHLHLYNCSFKTYPTLGQIRELTITIPGIILDKDGQREADKASYNYRADIIKILGILELDKEFFDTLDKYEKIFSDLFPKYNKLCDKLNSYRTYGQLASLYKDKLVEFEVLYRSEYVEEILNKPGLMDQIKKIDQLFA